MANNTLDDRDTGMSLRDLLEDEAFRQRTKRAHDYVRDAEAFRRLAAAFTEGPQQVLQELCDIAVQSCGADSAGISLEETQADGERKFRWVAIAGSFKHFLHGTTPRFFSPCGTCLDRGRAQLYKVSKPYYDFLGIEAAPINDGILIPWITDNARGTFWCVAHESQEAFDFDDYRLLENLANFASVALRNQIQELELRKREAASAAALMAHEMAHQINNPLQTLSNLLYLAELGVGDTPNNLKLASEEMVRLAEIVRQLLRLQNPDHWSH